MKAEKKKMAKKPAKKTDSCPANYTKKKAGKVATTKTPRDKVPAKKTARKVATTKTPRGKSTAKKKVTQKGYA